MNVSQLYTLLNATTGQSVGGTAITVKDTSSFCSLGNLVMSSSSSTDAFYQKLVDRIGATYCKYRALKKKDRGIKLYNKLDFGVVLQKINVKEIARAETNNSWTTQTNPFSKSADTTDITSTLYSKLGTFEIDKITYDYQLKTAFINESNMISFINMIFTDMYNGMELAQRDLADLTICTAIADTIAVASDTDNPRPKLYRKLVTEYNTLFTKTLTSATALYDKDFLKYAVSEIKKCIKNFDDVSNLFNVGGYEIERSAEDVEIIVHNDFSTKARFYLDADTYNANLVELSGYTERNYWQGFGENGDFDETTTINIKTDNNNTVNVENIICVVMSNEKVGVMIDRIRTKSIYNPKSELTNYFHKADYGSFVDASENLVVFSLN